MPDGSRGSGLNSDPSASLIQRTGDAVAKWGVRLIVGYTVGVLGAVLALTLNIPLPWFLGALVACLIAAVLNAPVQQPRLLSVPVRIVLGVAIGSSFTPELLGQFGGMVGSLVMLIPFMVMIIGVGTAFFVRCAGFDRPTAFFCAVPGGLTDMVTMATDAGANARAVTLIQATRILMIVALVPFWFQWTGDRNIGGSALQGVRLADFGMIDAAALIGLGVSGWLLAKRIGLAGAPIIGPMILSGLAHAVGLTSAKVPIELLIFAQTTLGIMLGAQFRGVTLKEFSTTLVWGIAFGLLLLVLTGIVTVGVADVTGFDIASVFLAYAPGGQAEISLLGLLLGLDVAFIALHHLVRLTIVIFGAQIVFASNKSWRGDS